MATLRSRGSAVRLGRRSPATNLARRTRHPLESPRRPRPRTTGTLAFQLHPAPAIHLPKRQLVRPDRRQPRRGIGRVAVVERTLSRHWAEVETMVLRRPYVPLDWCSASGRDGGTAYANGPPPTCAAQQKRADHNQSRQNGTENLSSSQRHHQNYPEASALYHRILIK